MFSNRLTQRHFFETRFFELKENGVRVMTKKFLDSDSFFVPFENIGIEPYEKTAAPGVGNALRLVVFFVAVLLLSSYSAGGQFTVALGLYLLGLVLAVTAIVVITRKTEVIYGFGEGLIVAFLKNNPHQRYFNIFVSQMQERKKKYLRERYLALVNANDFLDVQTLHWLRALGALKQEEIDVMMEKKF